MARPSKVKTEELKNTFGWLNADKYKKAVDSLSDLDFVRTLYDRSNIYRYAFTNTGTAEFFEKITAGNIIPATPMYDYFFEKNTAIDYGYLEESREVSTPRYIEPMSANHVLSLYESIPNLDDSLENRIARKGWYAYNYEGIFNGNACLNINLNATNAQILDELKSLLPKLRKTLHKQPAVKQMQADLRKFRENNILALCDFMICWKLNDLGNFGKLSRPIISEVVYANQRTPEDIKGNEIPMADELLKGDLSRLTIMGRSFQK